MPAVLILDEIRIVPRLEQLVLVQSTLDRLALVVRYALDHQGLVCRNFDTGTIDRWCQTMRHAAWLKYTRLSLGTGVFMMRSCLAEKERARTCPPAPQSPSRVEVAPKFFCKVCGLDYPTRTIQHQLDLLCRGRIGVSSATHTAVRSEWHDSVQVYIAGVGRNATFPFPRSLCSGRKRRGQMRVCGAASRCAMHGSSAN